MKFRIIRDYDEFQPQVLATLGDEQCWTDIGSYRYFTLEEARKVCVDYKKMHDNPIVEEFEM